MSAPTRRDVVRAGAGSALALGAAGAVLRGLDGGEPAAAAETGVLDVYLNEGLVPMVDGSLVFMRGFGDRLTDRQDADPSLTLRPHVFLADGTLVRSRVYPLDAEVPEDGRPEPDRKDPSHPGHYLVKRAHWASFFPPRTIIAETGATVRLRVHNGLDEDHELAVPEVASTGQIPPGETAELEFLVDEPGTYLYLDPTNAPVERVLGLYGALVVVPADDRWRLSPGGVEFERQWLWICQDVEPAWGRIAQQGGVVDAKALPPAPRYYLINERSGYLAVAASTDEKQNHEAYEETLPAGAPRNTDARDFSRSDGHGGVVTGQLIRMVNAGLVVHQMHFHGNHVWQVRNNGADLPRSGGTIDDEGHIHLQAYADVVELDPLERKEVVLPLHRPPETLDRVWAARKVDWHYPMHCHAEPSQTAAGGLYPGGLMADWTLTYPEPDKEELEHELFASQTEFSSNQPRQGSPKTEFRQRPDKTFMMKFFSRKLKFPDGSRHEMWCFKDPRGGRPFPGPAIRVTEGDIVHVELKPSKGPHTIHLHGMEPDPRNDGVGHTSFEVNGSYTYQWQPQRGVPGDPNFGVAGSYFYHCHVNTVLHVQMGMIGPLIVDPWVHPDYPVEPGARRLFVDGPLYDIATEILLAPYSIDPRWHELNHAAGLSGEDVGLDRFEPKHFVVLGGSIAQGAPRDGVWSAREVRANVVGNGHPTLLRILNGNYFPTTMRITTESGVPARIAEVISHDGRPFRDTTDPVGLSRPNDAVPLLTDHLAFGAAERYCLLLRPPTPGVYLIHTDWFDWRLDDEGPSLARRTVRLIAR